MMKPVLIVLAATILTITVGMVLMMVSSEDRQVITAPTPTPIPLEQVAQAAQVDLNYLIRHIQPLAQDYGFADEQEVTDITLGYPYQLYNINYDQAKNYTPNLSAEYMLIPEQRWGFPILLDGEAKGMADLATEDGELQFVRFSSNARVAQNLVDFQAKHDRAGERGPIKLLRISPLHTNFALTQYDGQSQVTLLTEAAPGRERLFLTSLDESQTYELKEVVPQIAEDIKELEQKYDN
ncbi:MAG: hypothetical protein AAGF95_32305 [Chloroflexota bacterium]